MSQGWVKIHREIEEAPYWWDAELLKTWLLLTIAANHKGRSVIFPGMDAPINLKPGQFITSQNKLAERLYGPELAPKKRDLVQKNLAMLEKSNAITIEVYPKRFTIITIVDWDTYQSVSDEISQDPPKTLPTPPQESPNPAPTPSPHHPINKNENNAENEKTKSASAPVFPEVLDTPDFRAAWADWEIHRKQKRTPLTPKAIEGQLKSMASWGHERALIALRHSTAMGYTGVFEPKTAPGPPDRPNALLGPSTGRGMRFLTPQFALEAIQAGRVTTFGGKPVPVGMKYNSDGLKLPDGSVWMTTDQLKTAEFH